MSHHEHSSGAGSAEYPTLTVKVPSGLMMHEFGQLDGLQPSMWSQDDVSFFDKESIRALTKRIALDIDPADIRQLFIRQEQGKVTLGIEFSSHAREQVFLNTQGKDRLEKAVDSLLQRAGYPFFAKDPQPQVPAQPSPGLSFTRFVQVANEVDAMRQDTAREPRSVPQRLAEMKMRHASENWAAKVDQGTDTPKEPRR